MQRYKLTVEYDGTHFAGFQRQADAGIRTVQGVLEARLQMLLAEPVAVHGSGRTDAGVHARGQVIHLDSSRRIEADRLRYALNRNLPSDLVVREAVLADAGFHARKSACGKWYSYHIFQGRVPPAIGRPYIHYEPQRLDGERFRRAFEPFIGRHNFRGFCGRGATVLTFERCVDGIRVSNDGAWWRVDVIGDGFLRKMVRNMVGSALDIACGRKKEDIIVRALASGDRRHAGATAPSQGLVLEAVYYDAEAKEKALQTLQARSDAEWIQQRFF